jgi:5'-deoxynucleotidase
MNPDLYHTGFVQRWHTHTLLARLGQTLGHHQWGVATIIGQLHPEPSAGLILAALWHDVGEKVSGDMPYGAKRNNPALSKKLKDVEEAAHLALVQCLFVGSDEDEMWINMADRLEAYLYVRTFHPHLLNTPEWLECMDDVMRMAEELGAYDDVLNLVNS